MITQEYFIKKISELAHMRCLTITPAAAKHISNRFSEFEEGDFDQAIDAIMMESERFDFVRLFKRLVHARADRLESEADFNRIQEGRSASRFFDESLYEGDCTRQKCNGCEHIKNCKVRGREWIKGINTILSKKRALGEGKQMAEDIIKFMTKDFMGGT